MRVNLPVTNEEVLFPDDPHAKIISVTDLNGIITDVNDTFTAISGYSREELIGQPQNIVRHPDMPSEVFALMWKNLKEGKAFMGVIKNRCKNGAFYWVNAMILPICVDGRIIGYESVRTRCTDDEKKRAEQNYKKLKKNGKFKQSTIDYPLTAVFLILLAVYVCSFINPGIVSSMASAALSLLFIAMISIRRRKFIGKIIDMILPGHEDPDILIANMTNFKGIDAKLEYAIKWRVKLHDTILTRVREASDLLSGYAMENLRRSRLSQQDIQKNSDRTSDISAQLNDVAHNVSEMMHEIMSHVTRTTQASSGTADIVAQSKALSDETKQSFVSLSQAISDINEAISNLNDRVDKIAQSANLIDEISGQTNLLALNASIEAARAGEHGRGFAVVADEVRNLSFKTQSSTVQIHELIDDFKNTAISALNASQQGHADAQAGLEQMHKSNEKLDQVLQEINAIADYANQMHDVVQGYSQTSEKVASKVESILSLSDSSAKTSGKTVDENAKLNRVADDLKEMVERFGS